MFFSLLFRISSAVVAYLYPGYASYKTLSQRPANEAEIERWLMYWSVVGCVVAAESAEWVVNWIPLYYPIKTIFILYLVLPQTKGSSYLYTNHLQPFFHAHEPQIDATLSSLKTRSYAFVQEKLRGLWGSVATSMSQPGAADGLDEGLHGHARGAPPSMHDPASGPANLMGSLLTSFGPNVLLQGMAFMNSAQNAATTRTNEARRQNFETPSSSRLNIHDEPEPDESVEERKRRLEAELAALSGSRLQGYQVDSTTGTDRFEEVDTPSDAEGDGRQGHHRPTQGRGGSWFGWGSSNAGYERVKND